MTDETPKKKTTKNADSVEASEAALISKKANASSESKALKTASEVDTAQKPEAASVESPSSAEISAEKPEKVTAQKKTDAPSADGPKVKAAKQPKKTIEEAKKRFMLTDLKPAVGARRLKTRVGRGRSSGDGKTCGRGHNGEGQRAGRSSKRGFEGGQMPLYRRMPKISGFELINQKKWLELTTQKLDVLAKRFGTTTLSLEKLEAEGLYKPRTMYGVRVIGNQLLSQAIQCEAHHFTPSAKTALENAGGKATLLSPSVPSVA